MLANHNLSLGMALNEFNITKENVKERVKEIKIQMGIE